MPPGPSWSRSGSRPRTDPATLVQPFVNLRLGRTYRVTYGQELKLGQFLSRVEPYAAEVPAGVEFLTLGADVQSGEINPRIEAAVYGWGRGLECWLIGHFVLPGDPAQGEVWTALDMLLQRRSHVRTARCCGCRRPPSMRVVTIPPRPMPSATSGAAGVSGPSKAGPRSGGRRTKVWPRKPSAKLGQVWHMIGGNAARDWVYGSLAVEKPGPRFVHFPEDPAAGSRPIDEEFFRQLTRERLVVRRQGFTEWEKPKAAHEAGVCFVYAYAAVCGLQAMSGRYVALGKLPEIVEERAAPAEAKAYRCVPPPPATRLQTPGL